jgi:hypothetical protein
MDGVAQDGEAIVCEDNNGWLWEPGVIRSPCNILCNLPPSS